MISYVQGASYVFRSESSLGYSLKILLIFRTSRCSFDNPSPRSGQAERDWEISEGPEEPSVAGRIHTAGQFWHNNLQASKFVTSIIDNGYRLPFERPCPPFYAKNNASSRNHPDFVADAIQKLVKQKCVKEVAEMPYCCNPLTVAGGKKLRLVLDLRHVNEHIQKRKFRYENLKTLAKIIEKRIFLGNVRPQKWLPSYLNSRRRYRLLRFRVGLRRRQKIFCFLGPTVRSDICFLCFHESSASAG